MRGCFKGTRFSSDFLYEPLPNFPTLSASAVGAGHFCPSKMLPPISCVKRLAQQKFFSSFFIGSFDLSTDPSLLTRTEKAHAGASATHSISTALEWAFDRLEVSCCVVFLERLPRAWGIGVLQRPAAIAVAS